jgi:predicted RND superfamily exporter protein
MKKNESKKRFTLMLVELLLVFLVLVSITVSILNSVENSSTISFKKDIEYVASLQERIKKMEDVYAYFDFTSSENNSVFEILDSKYSIFLSSKNTRIKAEKQSDSCYLLTAKRSDVIASYNNCSKSKKINFERN